MKEERLTWLIKSGDRILGPFNKMDIAHLLKTREVTMMDEAAQPFRRWIPIKDQPEFIKLIDEMRAASQTEQDLTQTTSMDSFTESVTEGIDENINAELTQDFSKVHSKLKEIVYENVEDQIDAKPSTNQSRYQSWNRSGQKVVEQKAKQTTTLLWRFTFFIILGVVGFVAYQKLILSPFQLKNQSKGDYERGIAGLKVGDFQTALTAFKRAASNQFISKDLDLYLGPLLIQIESQTLMGKRHLGNLLQADPEHAKEAWTGIGIAELIEGNLNSAEESFNKALANAPLFHPALINLGYVLMQKRDYHAAEKQFRKAIDSGADDGAAFLQLAESYIYQYKIEKEIKALDRAQSLLSNFSQRFYDYSQEAHLYSAYIKLLRGDIDSIENELIKILDIDPDLTADHRHNIFIFRKSLDWSTNISYCNQLQEILPDSHFMSALMSMCLVKVDRKPEARQWIDKAVAQNPRSALIQGVYAYVLGQLGRDEQASVALGKANEYNHSIDYELPQIMQARFCQKFNDQKCAGDLWKALSEKNKKSLQAQMGLAWVALQNNSKNEAKELINKVEKMSPDYKPFLILKEQGISEGWL